MVLKNWVKDFQFQPKMLRFIPLYVMFPRLPLYYWAEENLGRIASYISKLLPQELYIEKTTLITQAIKYEWTPQFCHTSMKMENKEGEFYDFDTPNARMRLWDSLRGLTLNSSKPWLILGDFNAILSHEDRLNGELVKPRKQWTSNLVLMIATTKRKTLHLV
ncbi:hypothetical protein RDI58_007204 [Solanum bulbocastanum]|uniref:Endonuclease/exonuclease/phosphatase domain-containing protein n=1 Tax=Solanum bulbocastanum TaxID=147425 RepID=A0AAN8YJ04_SOLBU